MQSENEAHNETLQHAAAAPVTSRSTAVDLARRAVGEGERARELAERLERLYAILDGMDRVLVAFSGGVDSTFLLRVAHDRLGDRVRGVLAFSESLDRNEYKAARELARELGLPVEVIETREYDNEAYRRNDPSRCYHCKFELFSRLRELGRSEGIENVLDGSNLDDRSDYRPGMKARDENDVRSPLAEAGLTKQDIRDGSRALGLPTWDKPAAPCLSSRIPYGSEVTHEKLRAVEAAEASLRALGFRVLRVRHHGELARIEIATEELPRMLDESLRQRVVAGVRAAGFRDVTLDLRGFRSGSLNESLGHGESEVASRQDIIEPSEIRRIG